VLYHAVFNGWLEIVPVTVLPAIVLKPQVLLRTTLMQLGN